MSEPTRAEKEAALAAWIANLDPKEVANIIASLSVRQPNGRPDTFPYIRSKQLMDEMPYQEHFVYPEYNWKG